MGSFCSFDKDDAQKDKHETEQNVDGGASAKNQPMKIKDLKAHFHFSAVQGGKPPFAETVDKYVDQYAKALHQHAENNSLLELFTEDAVWTDPVGTPSHVGREKIEERITKLPAMEFVRVREVYYTVDENIFMAKLEVHFSGKPNSFFIVDRIVLDGDQKIKALSSHFHPSAVMGGKPEYAESVDAFVEKYADALYNHGKEDGKALVQLFGSGDVEWTDPVGKPPNVGLDGIKERIKHMPDMEYVKVKEIFYTKTEKVFLVKVEIKFSDKGQPFIVMDSIELE